MHYPPVPASSSVALPCPASARATQHLKAASVTGASGSPAHTDSAETWPRKRGSKIWPEVGQSLQGHPPLSAHEACGVFFSLMKQVPEG